MKPFSQACENNKQPILEVLQRWLKGQEQILEVGSGTGQHAVFFAEQFPQVSWQCSDLPEQHGGILQWLQESEQENIKPPISLDVSQRWPEEKYDAIFSANTLHIMPWVSAPDFFYGAGQCLNSGGLLLVYGPFNYDGKFTSESNARFNDWLHEQNGYSGIRDFEAVNQLAEENHLALQEDNAMPANNRLLVWQKK